MVGNQIVNLTLDLLLVITCVSDVQMGHASPFQRFTTFQELSNDNERRNPMNFDPYDRFLKIQESIWDLNSQNGNSLGSVRVHILTFFCTPGSMRCDSQASLLTCTFISPCLGQPKSRIATIMKNHWNGALFIFRWIDAFHCKFVNNQHLLKFLEHFICTL